MHRVFVCLILVLMACRLGFAASPSLGRISPPGGQRGTEIDLIFEGGRLADAQEIFFYTPGFTVTKLDVVNDGQVKAHIKIAPEAALGEHLMRLRTASGISDLRSFYVGVLPIVNEVEPNSEFKAPQKVAMNSTITGIVQNEDVDYYVVEAKKGQRITAEVEGIRLGRNLFDSYVAILDANRFELAASDDSSLFLQDPVASCIAPADGQYIIQIRESSYGGDGNCIYRLHVGTFPRPRVVFPAGGQAGTDLPLNFLGDPLGPIAQTVKLPAGFAERFPLFAENAGQVSPSANPLRVSPFANVLEKEPNNDAATATPTDLELPLAFNGIIGETGDNDFFLFKAKKGQQFEVHCHARRLRSPLDPVMYIVSKAGAAIANNDDAVGPDSYFRFAVPEDGEYILRIRDHLRGGSPHHVYRIEMTPVQAGLTVSVPQLSPNILDQDRLHAFAVPRGNRFATLIRASRANFGGDVILGAAGLPAGVQMLCDTMPANLDVVPVVFEAAADAPIAGTLAQLTGRHADPNQKIAGSYSQSADLVQGGNNVSYYRTQVDRVAVAVTEELPFKISIAEPKVPIVQGGSMGLKVVVERKPGFAGAINIRMLFNPPGIGSGGATIPGDKNEAVIPLSADGGAQTRAWKIAVLGQSDVKGPVWVSTPLANLEVAAPFLVSKIEMCAAEQKQIAQVLCNLEQKTPFEGKAVVKLIGLPPNSETKDMEVTAQDAKVIFNVATSEKTPAGQHKGLYCQIIVTKNGEPIVHNVGHGGVLRIDPPPPPKKDAPPVVAQQPQAAPPPPPPPPTAKPLSRLEKLRLEQAEAAKKEGVK